MALDLGVVPGAAPQFTVSARGTPGREPIDSGRVSPRAMAPLRADGD